MLFIFLYKRARTRSMANYLVLQFLHNSIERTPYLPQMLGRYLKPFLSWSHNLCFPFFFFFFDASLLTRHTNFFHSFFIFTIST